MSTVPEVDLPPVDATTQQWWDATREHRLILLECQVCGVAHHYPRMLCPACGSTGSLVWRGTLGVGVIDSFTLVHRPLPGFEAPHIVARVRLAEGPVMLSMLVDGDGGPVDVDAVACDAPVVLRWRDLPDGRALPVFALASA